MNSVRPCIISQGELVTRTVEEGVVHFANECDTWLGFITAYNSGRSMKNIYGQTRIPEVKEANNTLEVQVMGSQPTRSFAAGMSCSLSCLL